MMPGILATSKARYTKAFDVSAALVFFIIAFTGPVNSARADDIGLIEPSMLKEQGDQWVVIDARPAARWREGHIPGAFSFSWEDYTRTDEKGIPYRLPPARELAEFLGVMGIHEQSAIVVYGDADTSWGGEGWIAWVLEWLGHKGPVRLLSGGIDSWKKAGFVITSDRIIPQARPVRYLFLIRPHLDITTEELTQDGASFHLIDTRSSLEWIQGHLPNAVHISWKHFYTGKERRPISRDALVELLRKNGIGQDKPIVYYCTGGMRSGYAWLVHELAGLSAARNYEGGYEAWKKLSAK